MIWFFGIGIVLAVVTMLALLGAHSGDDCDGE